MQTYIQLFQNKKLPQTVDMHARTEENIFISQENAQQRKEEGEQTELLMGHGMRFLHFHQQKPLFEPIQRNFNSNLKTLEWDATVLKSIK